MDREPVQVAQGGIARAEIVELDEDAGLAQAQQDLPGLFGLIEEGPFGDLETDPVRLQSAVLDRAQGNLVEIRDTQPARRDIDRNIGRLG